MKATEETTETRSATSGTSSAAPAPNRRFCKPDESKNPVTLSAAKTAGAKTILVVDDYASICEITARILRSEGYDVLTATTGEQALKLARETPEIDLLVTDFEMPKMRGDELARRCAAIHSDLPIIIISSGAEPIFIPSPFVSLRKPFHPSALI